MNKLQIAGLLVAVFVIGGAGSFAYYTYVMPDFAWEYDDCYLDVSDADTLRLKDTHPSGVLRTNFEDVYGGDTLYKTVDGSDIPVPVQMYSLDDEGERQFHEIDRDVRMIQELSEDMMLIVFYGVESDTNSYQCYMNGYKYDPNSQLTFLVDLNTGKMHNITSFTREIKMVNELTMEVFDAQYPLTFDSYDGERYVFICEKADNPNNIHSKSPFFLYLYIDDEENLVHEWGEKTAPRNPNDIDHSQDND